MHSNQEPNSFFGGMTTASWNSEGYICDPADECSWLFKIEIQQNKVFLHKWQCINKQYAAYGQSFYGPCFGKDYGGGLGTYGTTLTKYGLRETTYSSQLPSNLLIKIIMKK